MSWPTWKMVEVRVAEELSKKLGERVERIPILGRTGPDATIGERTRLVIDVKHRKEIPKGMRFPTSEIRLVMGHTTPRLVAIHIRDIGLDMDWICMPYLPSFKIVHDWFDHIREHQVDQVPDGIPAIVLHPPGDLVINSILVVHMADWRKFNDRLQAGDQDTD